MKKCKKCGEEKSKTEFYLNGATKDGLTCWCIDCNNKNYREKHLHRKYNLTVKQYELMLKSQNGVCKLCKRPETRKQNNKIKQLCVDHCHRTGKVRGLLCHNCNTAIALFSDDPELLRKAAEYLEKHHVRIKEV